MAYGQNAPSCDPLLNVFSSTANIWNQCTLSIGLPQYLRYYEDSRDNLIRRPGKEGTR